MRSLELKRPNTRVFLLNNLPDKVQKKSTQRCQILILGNFFFRNILVDGGEFGVVQSFFTQCCAFIKDAAVSSAVNVRVLVTPQEFT